MALRNQPYIPLYIQDYLTDEKLNECSASSQGVYIKLMCLMHKSDEYGCILLEQKYKQTDKHSINFASKLVKHLPFEKTIIENALDDLLENKVLIVEDDILKQKRMIKDNYISEERSKAGKKGGKKTQFDKAKPKAKPKANPENESENEFICYLVNKIKGTQLENYSDGLIDFIKYRMAKPKKEQYKTTDGIDVLIKDSLGCIEDGYVLNACFKYAKGCGWQTPTSSYFKGRNIPKVQGKGHPVI